jgi:hypothetical protein
LSFADTEASKISARKTKQNGDEWAAEIFEGTAQGHTVKRRNNGQQI